MTIRNQILCHIEEFKKRGIPASMKVPEELKGQQQRVIVNFAREVVNLCEKSIKQAIDQKLFFNTKINDLVNESLAKNSRMSKVDRISLGYSPDGTPEKTLILIGGRMESIGEALKITNANVEDQKRRMQELYNELIEMDSVIQPLLTKQINMVRDTRMTVDREISMMMGQLKDIRKFFIEDDYKKEIQRLNEFVGLMGSLKKLKEDGTLDALTETILKMSGVKEGGTIHD